MSALRRCLLSVFLLFAAAAMAVARRPRHRRPGDGRGRGTLPGVTVEPGAPYSRHPHRGDGRHRSYRLTSSSRRLHGLVRDRGVARRPVRTCMSAWTGTPPWAPASGVSLAGDHRHRRRAGHRHHHHLGGRQPRHPCNRDAATGRNYTSVVQITPASPRTPTRQRGPSRRSRSTLDRLENVFYIDGVNTTGPSTRAGQGAQLRVHPGGGRQDRRYQASSAARRAASSRHHQVGCNDSTATSSLLRQRLAAEPGRPCGLDAAPRPASRARITGSTSAASWSATSSGSSAPTTGWTIRTRPPSRRAPWPAATWNRRASAI